MRLPFHNFSSLCKESSRKEETNGKCDNEPDYENKETSSDFDSQSSAKSNEDNNDRDGSDADDGEITFDDNDDDFLDGLVENSSKSRELDSTSKIKGEKDPSNSQPCAIPIKGAVQDSDKRHFSASPPQQCRMSSMQTIKQGPIGATHELLNNAQATAEHNASKDVRQKKPEQCNEHTAEKSKFTPLHLEKSWKHVSCCLFQRELITSNHIASFCLTQSV